MKVLLLGLDGAEPSLIFKWAMDGKLPVFKKLMENGSYGKLESTIPSITCPAVPALYTGKNPGKFGVFSFERLDRGIVSSKDIKAECVWDLLEENGLKSLILFIKTTYPPKEINGIMLTGTLTPPTSDNFSYPKGIISKEDFLRAIVPINERGCKNNKERMLESMKNVDKKFEIFNRLTKSKEYSLYFIWFGETDGIQHFAWNEESILLEFYKYMDSKISEIVNKFDTIFIVSDHGFGEFPKKNFYVNTWLSQNGYLKLKGGQIGSVLYRIVQRFIKKMVSGESIRKVEMKMKGKKNPEYLPGIDWKKTQAYLFQNFGIKIHRNIQNDDPIIQEIIEKLKQLEDDEGNRVIKEIYRRDEIYSGAYIEKIPHILFMLNDQFLPKRVLNKKLFDKNVKTEMQGSHFSNRYGLIIAYGKGIKKSVIKNAKIYDVVPTILHILDCEIPKNLDGKVLNVLKTNAKSYNKKIKKFVIKESDKIKKALKSVNF